MVGSDVTEVTCQRIWIAGHLGMVGSALVRRFERENVKVLSVGRAELDLCSQADVYGWLESSKPDAIIIAAAKVGGIKANNDYPADFISQNLVIQSNIIDGAHRAGVDRLLFLGSSCIYPKFASQPITEEELLSGPLEPTNQWYAVAKIAGIKLCQAYRRQHGRKYISAMPCNVYGPNDNFDSSSSHVLAALMKKCHDAMHSRAKELVVWGTGSPCREFIHVDDLADCLLHVLRFYDEETHINCGSGEEISIRDLAKLVAEIVGFSGAITFDATMPDGTPRKIMDNSRAHDLGWRAKIGLREGIESTYSWFKQRHGRL